MDFFKYISDNLGTTIITDGRINIMWIFTYIVLKNNLEKQF